MWKPEQHSDDENLRWAWLRAVEWRHWPLFVSQPAVPVILYFYPWHWVIGAVVLATLAWWFIVAPRLTPATSIDISVYFVWLRFPISPLMAWWIWQKGDHWTAALALFWPFMGNGIVSWLLTIPQAALSFTAGAKAAQIGLVQERLMDRLGYARVRGVGYMRRGVVSALHDQPPP